MVFNGLVTKKHVDSKVFNGGEMFQRKVVRDDCSDAAVVCLRHIACWPRCVETYVPRRCVETCVPRRCVETCVPRRCVATYVPRRCVETGIPRQCVETCIPGSVSRHTYPGGVSRHATAAVC